MKFTKTPHENTSPPHTCGLPWSAPRFRGLGDPCPACEILGYQPLKAEPGDKLVTMVNEPKRAEPMRFVNCQAEPLVIRATTGRVTWRQLQARMIFQDDGGIELVMDDYRNFDESEHPSLLLHTGGFATMTIEDGKCIVSGTGLSAPGEPK